MWCTHRGNYVFHRCEYQAGLSKLSWTPQLCYLPFFLFLTRRTKEDAHFRAFVRLACFQILWFQFSISLKLTKRKWKWVRESKCVQRQNVRANSKSVSCVFSWQEKGGSFILSNCHRNWERKAERPWYDIPIVNTLILSSGTSNNATRFSKFW